MRSDNGGERGDATLAPVIPLFGGKAAKADAVPPRRGGDDDQPSSAPRAPEWHPTWVAEEPAPPVVDGDADAAEALARAEKVLLKKLRTRSLSIREARSALAEHDLDDDVATALLDRFVAHGYLDDEALAEQLIHKAVSRKGQGRQAIAQTLSQRGIGRDVIDIALASLPDDEAERALEFARAKAASMDSLERDVALRRLAGQLARRGYGSTALSAARQALDERSSPKSRVRFE